MTANSDRPGGAGSRVRRPFPARARLLGVVAALAAVLLAAGCSASSSSSSSTPPATSSTAPASAAATQAASPAGSAGPGTDIGLTATTIKVGVIADVNNPLVPGLFKDSVNAVKAWAAGLNASGGLRSEEHTSELQSL